MVFWWLKEKPHSSELVDEALATWPDKLTLSELQAEKSSPLQVKKLYVLAAFEVEKAREKNEAELTTAHGLTILGGGFAAGNTMTASTRAQATMQGLVTRDAAAMQVRTVMLVLHTLHLVARASVQAQCVD
jgi:hypothetical protein